MVDGRPPPRQRTLVDELTRTRAWNQEAEAALYLSTPAPFSIQEQERLGCGGTDSGFGIPYLLSLPPALPPPSSDPPGISGRLRPGAQIMHLCNTVD